MAALVSNPVTEVKIHGKLLVAADFSLLRTKEEELWKFEQWFEQ
jgi:hypothetical protein